LEGVRFSREEFAELRRRLGMNGGAAEKTLLEGKALERFEEKLRRKPGVLRSKTPCKLYDGETNGGR
jgi:hypothetical protein